MANETQSEGGIIGKDSSVAVAIILPSLFALILFILLTIACLLPKCTGEESEATKEQRRKKRLEKLENSIKAEHFLDWAKKERKEHPEVPFTTMLCVICLEEFDDAAQIRGLGCHHVFHQECLDDWFGRWNEYCPLCHRPIIPGTRPSKKERNANEPPPVAFMV
ncbi:hypothetical protein BU26DRAFT_520937 [Trematosphaeria pertusa]|uniref:RING-type domain-containing protein n=1 Tax=Trematosphaeria pertusa TaxID=390896 RepID=A0A6A6I8C8_9PLEO|nr:uncharacterized protein BU26DRAFT_520937 [Trematosphaeria pertusa]KAF2246469.1 hypothetical protein BU26DRAFT_520937 [Trematosphaeria pertusa]